MIWKKNSSETTISEVVYRNSGMTEKDLTKEWNTKISNLEKAANRLKEIAAERKSVTVFADYDCDGICSAIIMHLILKSLNINFNIMFPNRKTNYGINVNDVSRINTDVIITIDNGISAFDAIDAAKERGIEVIIIDHHLKPLKGTPDADIIIDPHVFKKNNEDFEDWCGAGLGYELSRLLCSEKIQNVAIQFAAIATVADVVPLRKDNRQLLIKGLELLNNTNIKSMRRFLLEICGSNIHVDEGVIGFKIAPIINAMSRIEDNAEFVYKYFISDDPDMLTHMIDVNEIRKREVAEAVDRAYNIIAEECLFSDIPLIVYDPQTPEGIVGIVAGRLAEEQKVPVICLTDSIEPDVLKGSARSPSIHICEALSKADDLLLKYGGHAGAAGLSLKKDKLDEVRSRFSEVYSDFEVKSNDEIYYDLEIDASEISTTMDELKKYAPFGEGNPNPVFLITNFRLLPRNGAYYQCMGVDESTIKLFGDKCSAIGFGMVSRYNYTGIAKNLDMIGKLSENFFYKKEVQVEIIDFVAVKTEKVQSGLSKLLADTLKNL